MGLGEHGHALAGVLGMAVAIIYDFFPIPGDEDKVVFLTLTTWSHMMAQMSPSSAPGPGGRDTQPREKRAFVEAQHDQVFWWTMVSA